MAPAPTRVWPIAATVAIGFFCSVLVTPLYPLYQRAFGFPELTLTVVYAFYTVGNVAALLVVGQLSDRVGRRRVVLPALGVLVLAGLVFLAAAGTGWLVAGRLLTGLAVGVTSSTATAWLADRFDGGPVASLVASASNLGGIALGPLLGGLLAEYAPLPLRLPLVVELVLLVALILAVVRTPDPRSAGRLDVSALRIRPRVGVGREELGAFAGPAIAAFVTFALAGLYFALIPVVVLRDLHIRNVAVSGSIVFELGVIATAVVVLARRVRPAVAMRSGLLLLVPAVALLTAAQLLAALPLLLADTAFAGGTFALGYRGSLQVVNAIAPPDRRGQITSAYLIVCFTGNSVPVIGVGVLSTLVAPAPATVAFAALLVLLAIAALLFQSAAERRSTVT